MFKIFIIAGIAVALLIFLIFIYSFCNIKTPEEREYEDYEQVQFLKEHFSNKNKENTK